MAKRIRSAIKKHRQSIKRRTRNVQVRSALKTLIKDLNTAIEAKDLGKSRAVLKSTISALDKASSKGVIHKKTASRSIGRLSKRVHHLSINSEQLST
jgi:small subunit ribosomal protein S20